MFHNIKVLTIQVLINISHGLKIRMVVRPKKPCSQVAAPLVLIKKCFTLKNTVDFISQLVKTKRPGIVMVLEYIGLIIILK